MQNKEDRQHLAFAGITRCIRPALALPLDASLDCGAARTAGLTGEVGDLESANSATVIDQFISI